MTTNHICGELEFATFYLGEAHFGIDITDIQEINKHFEITSVPMAEQHIKGILNLRGNIVTIMDTGRKLGLSRVMENRETRNIIVNSKDEHIGLMVDSIGDVVKAESKKIKPVPSSMGGIKARFFKGVLETEQDLVGILDMDQVLSD